jgi:hypothetical protein
VIETNLCAAEVLKHQLPEAQGAIICSVSATMLGIPVGAVMTARHSALKRGELEARAFLFR